MMSPLWMDKRGEVKRFAMDPSALVVVVVRRASRAVRGQ